MIYSSMFFLFLLNATLLFSDSPNDPYEYDVIDEKPIIKKIERKKQHSISNNDCSSMLDSGIELLIWAKTGRSRYDKNFFECVNNHSSQALAKITVEDALIVAKENNNCKVASIIVDNYKADIAKKIIRCFNKRCKGFCNKKDKCCPQSLNVFFNCIR